VESRGQKLDMRERPASRQKKPNSKENTALKKDDGRKYNQRGGDQAVS